VIRRLKDQTRELISGSEMETGKAGRLKPGLQLPGETAEGRRGRRIPFTQRLPLTQPSRSPKLLPSEEAGAMGTTHWVVVPNGEIDRG